MSDENGTNISLVDNTIPPELQQQQEQQQQEQQDETAAHLARSSSAARRWAARRPSVSIRGELARRKYAKWQPHKLGLEDRIGGGNGNGLDDKNGLSADARQLSIDATSSLGGGGGSSSPSRNGGDAIDSATSDRDNGNVNGSANWHANGRFSPEHDIQTISELDILYENQRGWFLFGIPLYSHSSLLNFDPSAWVTRDLRDSPVNITNAQLPDPSWTWAWQTWYVDMSADVDEQGWQYSFSFSSSAWHGSHPWFHSFVRRRRWVRLRTKLKLPGGKAGRSGFEEAHMLTADYFTIHTGRKRADSMAPSMDLLTQKNTLDEEPPPVEEIDNIPTLMYALKVAIVDREKTEALKRFIEEGGDEIFYLDEKIPEIMSIFVFQTSRWQFLNYLLNTINNISHQASSSTGKKAIDLQCKQENVTKAAESARHHITGPELVADHHQSSAMGLLDLTPVSKQGNLLPKRSSRALVDKPVDNGGDIKGIPKEAEVGREGHIYRFSS